MMTRVLVVATVTVPTVRHRHAVVVPTGSEERIPPVVLDVPDPALVVAEGLVGQGGQVQVEPLDLLVVGPGDHVVAPGVDGDGGQVLGSRGQFLINNVTSLSVQYSRLIS